MRYNQVFLPLAWSLNAMAQVPDLDVALDVNGYAEDDIGIAIEPYIESGYLLFLNSFHPVGDWAYVPRIMLVGQNGSPVWDEYFEPEPSDYGWIFSAFGGVDYEPGLGYVACGSVCDSVGKIRGVVLRLDEWGGEVWRSYHTTPIHGVAVNEVLFTADGGCLALGTRWVGGAVESIALRYDAQGTVLWTRLLMPSGSGGFTSGILALPDGGFMACGQQTTAQGGRPWYARCDQNGDTEWEQTITLAEDDAAFHCIRSDGNGGYVMLGRIDTLWNDYNTWHKDFYMSIDSFGAPGWLTRMGVYNSVEAALGFEHVIDVGYVSFGFGSEAFTSFGNSLCGYTAGLGLSGDSLSGARFTHQFNMDSLTLISRLYDMLIDTANSRILFIGGAKGAVYQGWGTEEDVWLVAWPLPGCPLSECEEEAPYLGTGLSHKDEGKAYPVPTNVGIPVVWQLPSTLLPAMDGTYLTISAMDGRGMSAAQLVTVEDGRLTIGTVGLSPGVYSASLTHGMQRLATTRFTVTGSP